MENQKNSYMIIGGIALVVTLTVLAILFIGGDGNQEQIEEVQDQEDESTQNEEDTITPEDTDEGNNEEQSDSNQDQDTTPVSVGGSYISYSNTEFEKAQSDNKDIALFFHASWCPTCRALDEDIVSGADRIPENVVIFKVDYDENETLKREYDIRSQHSVVIITPDEVRNLNYPEFDRIIEELNSV